jgi:hypothetical protein
MLSGSEQMRLTSTGLGIGTSSPGAKLDVQSVAGTSTPLLILKNTSAANASNIAQVQFFAGNGFGGLEQIASITALNPNAGNNNSGALTFATSALGTASTPTERMRLDSSGNLGLGVTPSAWSTFSSIIQGQGYALAGFTSGSNVQSALLCNAFFNGSNFIYRSSAAASEYLQISGQHQWFTAPSGTAGNTVSFSQVMTLDAAGSLVVGGTTAIAGSVLTLQETASLSAALSLKNRNSTQTWKIAVDAAAVDDKILAFIENAGSSVRMALTDTGNLGLGVTPSVAYGREFSFSADTSSGVGGLGARPLAAGNNILYLANNAKNTGAFTDDYWTSAPASKYAQNQGVHAWYTAPSGTAGNAISFTQALTLTADGNLVAGNTTTSFRINATVASGADRDIFGAQISGASNGFTVKWNHSTTTTRVNIQNLPTSSAGLAAGDLYNDSGTLKVA